MDNLTPGISTLVGFGDRMVFGPLWEGARGFDMIPSQFHVCTLLVLLDFQQP